MYMFTTTTGRNQSMTRATLDKLIEDEKLLLVPKQNVVDAALDAVADEERRWLNVLLRERAAAAEGREQPHRRALKATVTQPLPSEVRAEGVRRRRASLARGNKDDAEPARAFGPQGSALFPYSNSGAARPSEAALTESMRLLSLRGDAATAGVPVQQEGGGDVIVLAQSSSRSSMGATTHRDTRLSSRRRSLGSRRGSFDSLASHGAR